MKIYLALLSTLLFLFSSSAMADYDATRKALEVKLYDMESLVTSGITFNEYRRQLVDVKVLLGRVKREFEKHKFADYHEKSQHEYLQNAAESYIIAEEMWESDIRLKSEGWGGTNTVQSFWGTAAERLRYYTKYVSSKKLSSSTKTKTETKKEKICTAWENRDGEFVQVKSKCD